MGHAADESWCELWSQRQMGAQQPVGYRDAPTQEATVVVVCADGRQLEAFFSLEQQAFQFSVEEEFSLVSLIYARRPILGLTESGAPIFGPKLGTVITKPWKAIAYPRDTLSVWPSINIDGRKIPLTPAGMVPVPSPDRCK